MATSATVAAKPAAKTLRSMSTIEAEVSSGSKTLKDRLAASAEQTQVINKLQADMTEAIQRGDISKIEILNASFESASVGYEDLTRGLSEAMAEWAGELRGVGEGVKLLGSLSPQEQGLIDAAVGKVETAKAAVTQAEAALTSAYSQTTFLGMQKRAVDNAQSVLDTARANLATFEAAVETARQMAETQRRTRLQGMSLEQSLQNMQNITEEVVQIASDRIAEIDANLVATEAGGRALQVELAEISQKRTDAEQGVIRLNSEITNMTEEQRLLTPNSPEWVKLGSDIAEKTRARDELEGTHNSNVALYQETQRFIEMYKTQEKTQRNMRKFHQVWTEMLNKGVKERTTLYIAYLGLVQAADDQRAMQTADKLALRVDEDISFNAAEIDSAIMGNMMNRLEQAPEDIRRIRDINEAMDENDTQYRERLHTLVKLLEDDWGGTTATLKESQVSAAA